MEQLALFRRFLACLPNQRRLIWEFWELRLSKCERRQFRGLKCLQIEHFSSFLEFPEAFFPFLKMNSDELEERAHNQSLLVFPFWLQNCPLLGKFVKLKKKYLILLYFIC